MPEKITETLVSEWVEALRDSTYFKIIEQENCSHDDFWRNFQGYDKLMEMSGYPGETAECLCKMIKKGSTVLDIGCGTGAFTLPLSEVAKTVFAVDPSLCHLSVLEKKAEKLGIRNIHTINATCRDLPAFFDEKVDYAVSAYSCIDPDIVGFLNSMIVHSRISVFIIYRGGEIDPLNTYAKGNHRYISEKTICGILCAMGYQPETKLYRRDYLLPVEKIIEKYRDCKRKPDEIIDYLHKSDRIVETDNGCRATFTTYDALITVKIQ
ncbi:MAG: class I SAM-dependent methyltransferase [Methanogenium sp.]|nr:class I SAM-dependent methyltransferase [Methanogenium sp.]